MLYFSVITTYDDIPYPPSNRYVQFSMEINFSKKAFINI